MHRTVIKLKGTGKSETNEIKEALEGQSAASHWGRQSRVNNVREHFTFGNVELLVQSV